MVGVISEPDVERDLDPASRLIMLSGGLLAALAMTAINSVLPRIDEALGGTPTASLMIKQLVGGVGLAMVLGSAISGYLAAMGLRMAQQYWHSQDRRPGGLAT